jgi:hypothetical protein
LSGGDHGSEVPRLANLGRDFVTFSKQAPHENVAPRNWPDHPPPFPAAERPVSAYLF